MWFFVKITTYFTHFCMFWQKSKVLKYRDFTFKTTHFTHSFHILWEENIFIFNFHLKLYSVFVHWLNFFSVIIPQTTNLVWSFFQDIILYTLFQNITHFVCIFLNFSPILCTHSSTQFSTKKYPFHTDFCTLIVTHFESQVEPPW